MFTAYSIPTTLTHVCVEGNPLNYTVYVAYKYTCIVVFSIHFCIVYMQSNVVHSNTPTDLTLMHMVKSAAGQSCKEACFQRNMVGHYVYIQTMDCRYAHSITITDKDIPYCLFSFAYKQWTIG